jgi:serine/threonine protein kinase
VAKQVVKHQVLEKYAFADLIGTGASGRVFLAQPIVNPQEEDGEMQLADGSPKNQQDNVAIKVLSKDNIKGTVGGLANLIQEIKVHWALEECEGVLRLLEIYEDPEYVYLVLEYQSEGSLMNGIQQNRQMNES